MSKQKDEVVDLGLVAPTQAGDEEQEESKQLDLFDQLVGKGAEDDEAAVELDDAALGSLAEEYRLVAELTRKKRKLENDLSTTSRELSAAKERMQNAMKLQGTRQFKGTDDDGACSVGTRYNTKVVDAEAFISFVMSHDPTLLTVNAQTRTKYVRENFRDKGIPADSGQFPPGIEAEEEEFLQVRGVRDTAPS